MENFFQFFLLLILFIIISLVVYYVIFEIKNRKICHEKNKIKKWQKDRLRLLINERIKSIKTTGKTIHADEKEILSSLIDNIENLEYWDELEKIVNDSRINSFINVAIMDNLYISEMDTTESKNKFLQNLFLLDCVNGGVKFEGKNPVCYPKNLDIKETIQVIINNQKELTSIQSDILSGFVANAWEKRSPETYNEFKREYLENNFKSLISDSAVDKTLTELINKKYVKDLSKPAKLVISKIIIEILSNIIYSGNRYEKLSENTKIYVRILANVIANEPYEIIYNKFHK